MLNINRDMEIQKLPHTAPKSGDESSKSGGNAILIKCIPYSIPRCPRNSHITYTRDMVRRD